MFEDESIDVACPKCGHRNSILVRAFEESAEVHFVCAGEQCKAAVKVEAKQFRKRLDKVRREVEELERAAGGKRPKPTRKGDFQI
ncbi:MAG: hypothetical protein ACREQI_16750 [Candidatus Binataceae bacterium]